MSNDNAQTVSIAVDAPGRAFFQGVTDAGELEKALRDNSPSGVVTPEDWAFAVGRAVALRFGEDSGSEEAVNYVRGLMIRAPHAYRVEVHSEGQMTFELGHQVKVHVTIDPYDEEVAPKVAVETVYHERPEVLVNGDVAYYTA
jgi:adenine/guanine phosphoribosyltransferase-like PRPP-binding protein